MTYGDEHMPVHTQRRSPPRPRPVSGTLSTNVALWHLPESQILLTEMRQMCVSPVVYVELQGSRQNGKLNSPGSQASHVPRVLGTHTSFVIRRGISRVAMRSSRHARKFLWRRRGQKETQKTCLYRKAGL